MKDLHENSAKKLARRKDRINCTEKELALRVFLYGGAVCFMAVLSPFTDPRTKPSYEGGYFPTDPKRRQGGSRHTDDDLGVIGRRSGTCRQSNLRA